MDNTTRYAAINTKIRAMESSLLSVEDYLQLIEKQSVEEVAEYLKKKTGYKEVLKDIDSHSVHRGTLESIIKQNMIFNIDKIIHYFNGEYKRFIYTLYARFEIEELKTIARAVYNKEDTGKYKGSVFIGKYSGVDTNKIFDAKLVRDIIFALEGSEFYRYLLPLIDNNVSENLFRFEMVLDLSYYDLLKKAWSKLSKQDIKILEQSQGLIADLLNLQWIYRGIKFYRLQPEILLNYTIRLGHRLDFSTIKRLCYSRDLNEFYEYAQQTKYSFLFKNDGTTDIFMERRLDRHIYFEIKALVRTYGMSIITTFAYVLFLEFEVRDIIAITEAIRYKVPKEEARKYLIRKLREGT
ncbi:MAG: V-type ATPase subunit [Bacillota bacterium]